MPTRDDQDDGADAALARAWVDGADNVTRRVWERYGTLVHTYCVRALNDRELAADCVQETFVSAWRSRERFDPSLGSLPGWLLGIARHRVHDAYRVQARTPLARREPDGAERVVDSEPAELVERMLVADALTKLAPRPRQVLELAFYDGLSQREIADRLVMPLGTVKSDMRRALLRLRGVLGEVTPVPDEHDYDDDVVELRALFERTRPGEVEWEPPPDELWDRIAAGIEAPDTGAAHDPVVPLAGRRRRGWWIGLVAAAAAVILVVAVVALVAGDDEPQVVATAELEPLGDTGSGRAELVDRDGAYQVRLQTDGIDAEDGYLELWLIDPTVTKLVSLGPLRADGLYDVPPGVDPREFPVVDVSVEPVDGDPTHSGDSVLRGQLTL